MSKKLKYFICVLIDTFIMLFAFNFALLVVQADLKAFYESEWYYLAIAVASSCLLNLCFGIYSKLLRYFDLFDGVKMIFVGVIESCFLAVFAIISERLNLSWCVIASMVYIILFYISRFAFRFVFFVQKRSKAQKIMPSSKRVMIIGAGAAGSVLINEIRTSDKVNYQPVCALDDDEKKLNQEICGVKIVGKINDAPKFVKEYSVDEIIIAMPSVGKSKIKEIFELCQKTGANIKTVPAVYQLAGAQVSLGDIKEVSITDLLGREQVKVNLTEIVGYLKDKTVLVTGGGGSIGSELCRQIANSSPKRLIILDIYENNAYDIQQELKRHNPELDLVVLIASVRDHVRIDNIFEKYKPQIVFHAAAHKHVPLMENSPNEAIKNNVSGTYKVADAAGRNGVERFILISTDKAVNPTNIMGASKRICEMIIQTMNKVHQNTRYVAVRFGNVLGSNGSVIPLFKNQIKEGGPVTVTHKDIVRYFMTIPEAVSLVLQAGAYANGGEIFVLDMGEPVKIYDLAINMIKLSGLEPFKDIEIKISGLRPGEKLYEERLMAEEGLKKTANDMISVGQPLVIDEKNLFKKIQSLYDEAYNETDKMKDLVHELVPTYVIDREHKDQN